MQEELSTSKQATGLGIGKKVICGLAAIILALVAIFPLSGWAEAAELHHYLQHVLIFLAGTGLGATVFGDYFKTSKVNQSKGGK